MLQRPVTAPSLISLSPPRTNTVTQARFASLIRRDTRTPSPLDQDIRERVPAPSPTRDSSVRDLGPLPPAPPAPNFTGSSTENLRPLPRRSGSIGLLMNAVNSAVNRKAKAFHETAGEQGRTGSPEGGKRLLNTIQSESQDNASAVGVEDKSIDPPDTEATTFEVQQEAMAVDEEKASSVESPTPSVQRSKSESESDTSSRKKTKERKGFLRSVLLRKKEDSGRSASSTPDAERDGSSSSDVSSKKGRKWGWKSESQEVKEQKAKALLDTML